MEYRNYLVSKIGFIEVINSVGLKVTFTSAGAGIFSIFLNNEKITENAENETSFLNHELKYGKTTRLLDVDSFIINGIQYNHNKDYDLSNLLFNCVPNFQKKYFMVQYSFKKKKMLDGLPGKVTYYVTYVIKDDANEITIDYRAISSDKTPLYMSHQMLFVPENNKYKMEVESNYDSILHNENPHGTVIHPLDENVQCGYSFNKQLTYKFISK